MRARGSGHDPGADGVDPLDVRQVERRDRAERVEPRWQVAEAGEGQASGKAHTGAIGPIVRFEIRADRSEEHTSELQTLMSISYAGFCLKKNKLHRAYRIKTVITNH